MGSITTIAAKCQVQRITVYRLLEKCPQLKKEMEDEVNRITDLVEKNLKIMALKSNFKAMKFYLETKGKDRGYGRHLEIDQKSENKTTIDLAEFENYLKEENEPSNEESHSEGHK